MKSIFRYIRFDLPASIVVFLVALPLCLGVAVASDAAPVTGLIAGMVGGIVVGIFSGSPLSVSGPAAGLTAIVATSLGKLPSYEVFLAAVVLAGVLQLVLGYARAGLIGDFIPNAVIRGMLAAIGLILILKQLPHLVGYDAVPLGDQTFLEKGGGNTFSSLVFIWKNFMPGAVTIGLLSLLLLFLFEQPVIKKSRLSTLLPGPLLVVLLGLLLNYLFAAVWPAWQLSPTQLVQLDVYSNPLDFFGAMPFPDVKGLLNWEAIIVAVTVALVASIESLLSLEAIDKLDPDKRISPTNRELKAQGVGNIVSGLLGGLPVTSVIVRSSANVNAGGKTKLSAIFHGVWLMLCVLFIPGLLNLIPLASLAAILIFTGYKLAQLKLFTAHYKAGLNQFIPFAATVVAILLSDLLIGIIIGIAVGFFFVIRRNFTSAIKLIPDQKRFILRFGSNVPYLNKAPLKKIFEAIPDGSSVLIDATKSRFIDADIIDLVNDFTINAKTRDIRIYFKYNGVLEKGFFNNQPPIELH